jgi:hypothetical protein
VFFFLSLFLVGEQIVSFVWFVAAPEELAAAVSE